MKYQRLPLTDNLVANFLELGENNSQLILYLCGANNEPEFNIKFIRPLAEKYHVIALCYPGIGNKDGLMKHTVDIYLELIDLFIKTKIAGKKFHIVGVSLGAFLGVKYLHDSSSENIESLLLMSPLTHIRNNNILFNIPNYINNEWQRIKSKYDSLFIPVYDLRNLRNLFQKHKHLQMALNLKMTQDLADNQLPKLVIVGRQDKVIDTKYTLELFNKENNSEVIVIEDQGHDAPANIGPKVFEYIDEFLSKF